MGFFLFAGTVSKRFYKVGRGGLCMSTVSGRASVLMKPKELADKIKGGDNNLIVLDSSWHMPGSDRDAFQEFSTEKIPNSQFFDIDRVSDKSSPLPHTVPTPEYFTKVAQRLGVMK